MPRFYQILGGVSFLILVIFSLGQIKSKTDAFSSIPQYTDISNNLANLVSTKTSAIDKKQNRVSHLPDSARNSTLGFASIQAIVMPHRDDQKDILALLGSVYGLDISIAPGVYPEDVKIAPLGAPHVGEEGFKTFQLGEIAAWRAHANVWREMLLNKWQTTLILEGDADFQMNIHDEMAKLVEVIPQLMAQLLDIPGQELPAYDPNDPYRSQAWDILQLGWCDHSVETIQGGSVLYESPTTMPGKDMHPNYYSHLIYGEEHVDMRNLTEKSMKMLRVSLGGECLTAYAVSRRGAAKMLHKTTRAWRGPIDVALINMSHQFELAAFHVVPPFFRQRKYLENKLPSSDIHASHNRKRLDVVDFDATLNANVGFDGEDSLWRIPEDMVDRSATMAMSGLLWPEKSSAGPLAELAWVHRAKDEIALADAARANEAA